MIAQGDLLSAQRIDFPPCSSLEAVELAEELVFVLCGLTNFIRPITAAERAAGVPSEYDAAFVLLEDGRITHHYGNSFLHN